MHVPKTGSPFCLVLQHTLCQDAISVRDDMPLYKLKDKAAAGGGGGRSAMGGGDAPASRRLSSLKGAASGALAAHRLAKGRGAGSGAAGGGGAGRRD